MSSERSNIKWGTILSYLALVISVLGTLLTTDKVLDLIGDYNYGLYSFVGSITSWLTVITAALNASFVRFSTIDAKEHGGDSSRINTLYFKLFVIIDALVAVVSLGAVCFCYFNRVQIGDYSWAECEQIYGLFLLSVLNIVLTIPTSVYGLYISYKKKFIFGRIISIVFTVFNYVAHILLAYLTRSVFSIAVFSIFSSILSIGINLFYCKRCLDFKLLKLKLRDNIPVIRSIVAFSGVILFNTIVDQINNSVDKTILGYMKMPESVTVYQLGAGFVTYLITMSCAVSGVYVPTIHELVVQKQDDTINELFLKISKLQVIIMTIVSFGFLACGKDFILWWVGEERIDAYYIGAALMLLYICPLSINASIEIQRARNQHLFRAIVYFLFALLNVGLSLFFMTFFEGAAKVYGCVLGTVFSTIGSHWISMNIYNKVKMKLPIGRYLVILVKYLCIGAVSFGIVFACNLYAINKFELPLVRFLFQGCIFVAAFGGLSFILDRKYFISLLKSIIR